MATDIKTAKKEENENDDRRKPKLAGLFTGLS